MFACCVTCATWPKLGDSQACFSQDLFESLMTPIIGGFDLEILLVQG